MEKHKNDSVISENWTKTESSYLAKIDQLAS